MAKMAHTHKPTTTRAVWTILPLLFCSMCKKLLSHSPPKATTKKCWTGPRRLARIHAHTERKMEPRVGFGGGGGKGTGGGGTCQPGGWDGGAGGGGR